MTQIAIPCLFMRAGTSRGPFFNGADLPQDIPSRDAALAAALGSGEDGRQLDGIGGGDALTSKAAIVVRSDRPGIDVEYTFAQVATDRAAVDTGPSCGNMLAGVGPFAIETGLVRATAGETFVRIYDRNTGSIVEATVQTPDGRVDYRGDTAIDGAPGCAAPVRLAFANIVGAKTGALFPTGQTAEAINGLTVTLIDVATPMALIRASDLGLTGHETAAELDAMPAVFKTVEAIRLEAGRRMGLGDVSGSVIPKVALIARARSDGAIASRYLTPWRAHKAHAVTGAICVAAASQIPGTIAAPLARPVSPNGVAVVEHAAGAIAIALEIDANAAGVTIKRAGVIRTARLLMRGAVMVPAAETAVGLAGRRAPNRQAMAV